jgi:hypothetical protein
LGSGVVRTAPINHNAIAERARQAIPEVSENADLLNLQNFMALQVGKDALAEHFR